jgi:hypothetical protein
MKRKLLILAAMSMIFSWQGCNDVAHNWPSGGNSTIPEEPKGDVVTYVLGQVLQYDPANVDGVDILGELDFFGGMTLTLYLTDGEITALEFDNDCVPFLPYSFDVPTEKVECLLDKSVTPNEIRLKATNEVIAVLDKGKMMVDFRLDSEQLSYRYTFKTVE